MNKKTLFLYLPFITWLLLPIPKLQASMVKLSLEQLVQDSDLIILGTVDRVESKWVTGKIFSFATISVNSKIKEPPNVTLGKVIVSFPGGKVGEIAMKVGDGPDYKQGENVLMFLRKIPNQPYYSTLGSLQGKFLIIGNNVVQENTSLDRFLEAIQNILLSIQ